MKLRELVKKCRGDLTTILRNHKEPRHSRGWLPTCSHRESGNPGLVHDTATHVLDSRFRGNDAVVAFIYKLWPLSRERQSPDGPFLRYSPRPNETLHTLHTFLLGMAVILLATALAGAQDRPWVAIQWEPETVRLFATLPVQDAGRVKPLDTFASFKLLKFNGKRTCQDLAGRSLTPVKWLIDCLFYPEVASEYKTFSVDNAAVLVALGLPFEKKRDRYSYQDLLPARAKLLDLARQYGYVPDAQKTIMESQLVNLAQNVIEFENLLGFLKFARHRFSLPPSEPLAQLFPGQQDVPLTAILDKGPELGRLFMDLIKREGDKANSDAVMKLFQDIEEQAASAAAIRLIPPASKDVTEWLSPADVIERSLGGKRPPQEQIALIANLERLANAPPVSDIFIKQELATFHAAVKGMADARGEYRKIPLEVAFYRAQFFYYSLVLYVFSFVLVAVSWLKPRSRSLSAASQISAWIPTLLLACGIAFRCVIRGRPPVTTLYETILFSTWVAVTVSLVMEFIQPRKIALTLGAILGLAGLFLANKYEMKEGVDTMPSMIAVLNTNFWLATHVTTITIGYGAGFLAAGLGHVYILGRLFRIKRGNTQLYTDIARMTYGVLCFSLLFSVVGTVLGGVWANESWGRFWGWDPKENGALMIVLWQLAILHARMGGYIREYGINLGAIFGGVVVAFSWFGVNLLGVGLHSYGFTSGTYRVLLAFYIVEMAVLVLGCAAWNLDRVEVRS